MAQKKQSAAVTKKGAGRPKKIGGQWHVWRKGYTVKSGPNKGKRVAGRYVKAPKGFSPSSTKKAPKRRNPRRKVTTRRKVATKKKQNPSKVSPSSIKIAATRKTAPGGWKSSMGPYVIVTAKGNMVKGGSFRDLDAAKRKLASLRSGGRKGLKLVKVTLSKKRNPAKKVATKKVATKRPRRKAAARRRKAPARRRKARGKAKGSKSDRYGRLIKRLGL